MKNKYIIFRNKLTEDMQDFYIENHVTLLTKIKEDTHKWTDQTIKRQTI